LLDRFDLRVWVGRPSPEQLLDDRPSESSTVVRERVIAARALAGDRGHGPNATLTPAMLDEFAPLTADARAIVRTELDRGRLSGRGLHRVRRVARTIADLRGGGHEIGTAEVVLALQMRVDLATATVGARS
jgi:magnesium chelatase family protein